MDSNKELIEGLLQFVTLAESERKLLAADLHDQTLSDLRELAQLARRLLGEESDPEAVRDGLARMAGGLEMAMDEVRRVMESLSPSALDALGLLPALESCLCRASASCNKPLEPRFVCSVKEDEVTLSETEQLLAYRIVQESLNNVCKHASANWVGLEIARDAGDLVISVTDDGCGLTASGDLGRARGLENMRYRARLIGGVVAVRPRIPESGTLVEVRLPLK